MSGHFFNFPLALLALPGGDTERIQRIVSYCIVENGKTQFDRLSPESFLAKLEPLKKPNGYSGRDFYHQAAVLGADKLHVTTNDIRGTITRWKEALEHLEQHRGRYGKHPLVFVGTKPFWMANSGAMKYTHFAVLCGINSVIGMNRSAPVRITRDMILARAHGYKGPRMMKEAGTIPMLTTWQLKDTLNKLEASGEWFTRVAFSPRCTFFSASLDREQVCQMLEGRIQDKPKLEAFRAADRARFSTATIPPNHRQMTAKSPPL